MKIPIFNYDNYEKCVCGAFNCKYTSKKCLHKLCDNCYPKKERLLINNEYNCQFCNDENKESNIYKFKREDFSSKPLLEEFYEKDKREREKLIYKRRENFFTEEEYNDYLEYVEKCLRKNNIKELEKKYKQDNNEKEENINKRKRDKNSLDEKIKENSPTQYNNSRIIIDFEGNIKQSVEAVKELDPIKIIEDTIQYKVDQEKEKICGGYNINSIYQFLSNFSKGGFINHKGNK